MEKKTNRCYLQKEDIQKKTFPHLGRTGSSSDLHVHTQSSSTADLCCWYLWSSGRWSSTICIKLRAVSGRFTHNNRPLDLTVWRGKAVVQALVARLLSDPPQEIQKAPIRPSDVRVWTPSDYLRNSSPPRLATLAGLGMQVQSALENSRSTPLVDDDNLHWTAPRS